MKKQPGQFTTPTPKPDKSRQKQSEASLLQRTPSTPPAEQTQTAGHLMPAAPTPRQLGAASNVSNQALLSAIPDLLFCIGGDGTYLSCQAAADYDILVSPEQFVGKSVYQVMPEKLARLFMGCVDRALKTGTIQTLEYPLTVGDQTRYYEARIGVSGPDEVLAMIRNISNRKQAEQALRDSEERFRALLMSSPDTIYLFDVRQDQMVFANRDEFCGYTAAELKTSFFDAIHSEDVRRLKAHWWRLLNEGITTESVEYRLQSKSGDWEWIQSRETVLAQDENKKPTQILITLTIITERKRTEQELQEAKRMAEAATRAKSAFLANMSHEIRTPMNAVMGMTSLLLDTHLTLEQQEFVETIRTGSDALLEIINDILDFSKIESGKLELDVHLFDLRVCIEEALGLLSAEAAGRNLELTYHFAPETPRYIYGDVTRLRQILVNLISNAIKFTEEGEVVVSVTAHVLEETEALRSGEAGEPIPSTTDNTPPSYELHFTVRDTGIGIPQERMDRLFQSFSQIDASMTRKYGGTGLGLAISKRLCELMGGRIWVESVAGQGSTFSFTIHAQMAPEPYTSQLQVLHSSLDGRHILIVDDNETNRRILVHQAQHWGLIPKAVASGHEALAWLRENHPVDVAVLDMQMPEMDGLTLASAIHEQPATRTLPLVMFSSVGRQEEDRQLLDKHFVVCLNKPVKQTKLHQHLHDIILQQSQPQSHWVPSQLDGSVGQHYPRRILLAEDNLVNQKVAIRMLQRLGYRADVAANGLEVLEGLRRQQYDVILMDVQMPEMDGLKTTRIIRQKWPETEQPYIIALTANAMQRDHEKCLDEGMDDYLSKPVKVESLATALKRSRILATNDTLRILHRVQDDKRVIS